MYIGWGEETCHKILNWKPWVARLGARLPGLCTCLGEIMGKSET